jgi:single-strand DNA-binding protein
LKCIHICIVKRHDVCRETIKTNIMNAIKNKVQLIGNLGANPEVKALTSGRKVANWKMATNEMYVNASGEKVNETQWHHVVAWGKLAELAEKYLNKGSEVAIEGKLTYREYTDASGAKRYFTEVVANEMLLMDKKPS